MNLKNIVANMKKVASLAWQSCQETVPIVTMRCDYNAEFLSSCTSENYSE